MPLETNFDAAPYFDDFDANNNFYRVLFKPGFAVQARELTQLQTSVQDQIERFGRHIFKDGSVVEGCALNFDDGYSYVKVTDTATNGAIINVSDFVGNRVVSAANLQAVIVNTLAGLESNDPNLNTLYVKYLNSANYANGSQQKAFDPDEVLSVVTAANATVATIAVANSSYSPIGNGYAVSIAEGTIFNKGFFVRVDPQTLVVSKYSNSPEDVSVGFYTRESIVTADSDGSLFDNAQGSPNFSAPGANRLKLSANLVVRAVDTTNTTANTTSFFSIVDFNGGKPVVKLADPQYAKLGAEMARRTYEESGNYIVDPFELSVSANSTNANNLVLEVSRGLGYVLGYRVEYADTNRASIRKGTDTLYFPNQIITANYGNYVFVDELAGVFDINNLDEVGLYATAATKLTSGDYTPAGSEPTTKIGTAKVRGIEYSSGTPGTPSCQYRMYLFDISITEGGYSFEDVRSIYATDGAGVAGYADTVLVSGQAVLRETASPDVVFNLGRNAVQTINTTATSFVYKTKTTRTFQANGTAGLTPPTSHPGGTDTIALTGSLSEANELRFIVIANTTGSAVNVAGVTVSVNTASPNVEGSASFTSNFAVGDYLSVGGDSATFANNIRRVVSITNSTHLVVNSNFANTLATANVARQFPAGVPIPFTRDDSANVVVASDGSSATLDLGTNLASTFVASIYYDVFRNQATQAAKTVNKNRLVKIEANTSPAGSSGPWCLGLADAYKLRAVYQGTTFANTNPELSRFFVLDSGQKGSHYGLSYLSIRSGSGHTVGPNDRLLVVVDHFTPDYSGGIGYFSAKSYPIDDVNTSNATAITTPEIPLFTSETGVVYDLRDSIDFRPYANNTANSATVVADATVNPSANVSLFIDPDGAYSPSPDQNFNTAFSYYLGRKDKVALTPEGRINVVEGAPSTDPVSPRDLDGTMTLGVLTIPPYPSLSQSDVKLFQRQDYGVSVNLQQNRRYTMRDIGTIDKKMARLEYYTSLSLLEASAKTLIVKDDAGIERFKNGFVVDAFKDFTVSDTKSPEFRAAIDVKLQELAPTINRTYVDLDIDTAASANVVKEGSLVMLVGNTVPYIQQPFASKVRNCVENIIYVWNGNVDLSPEGDFQPDVDVGPDVIGNIDLSGLTDIINALPNLRGTERIIQSAPVESTVTRTTRTTRGTTTTRDVIATTTQTTVRSDLDFSATTLNNVFDFGELVQDVSIQQFIRPRRVRFTAYNLKPSTRVYPYFDGQPVSVHCTPTDSSFVPSDDKGTEIVSDASGKAYGYFDIPAETFKVGDRVFRLCDVDDLEVAALSVTTQAAATYSASNISITKARYALGTRIPQIAVNTNDVRIGQTVSSRVVSSTSVTTPAPVRARDPIAQTFLINEGDDDSGIFLKKLDLYFRTKHPTLGVEVQIREVENGSPTLKIVPFGRKVLEASQVTVSNDASLPTPFEFDTPVFLQSGIEYCFVVMPVGSNDGYNIWVGEVGGTDVTTGNPIYVNNSTGVLFTSSTNRVWTPFQKEDIKFVLHRRDFTSTSGRVVYKNSNSEYLTANNFGGQFTVGEKVYVSTGSNIIESNAVASNTSNAVAVIANGTSNAQALFVNGSYVYVTSSTGTLTDVRFITSVPNATHIVLNSDLSFSDSNCAVGYLQSNGDLYGTLTRVASNSGIVHLASSTANSTTGFGNVVTSNATAILIGAESRAKANLVSVDNVTYSIVVPQFSYVAPTGTSISVRMKGSNSSSNDATTTVMNSDIETFFTDRERTIRSYSNELQAGGSKSIEVTVPMTTSSTKSSPFVDDIKSGVLTIENVICTCADVSGETAPGGGSATAKYVSKRVVLAEGQDAEDLQVYLSAYKPSNTNIRVFAKFLNGDDSEGIDAKYWTFLNQNTSAAVVSSRVERNDFKEFLFDVPFKYSVNASSTTAMADYAVYGTFSNTDIASNTISISNSTPLNIGDLVYYIGDASNSISNGFFSVLTANSTAIKLATAGTSAEVLITPEASSNTASLHFVPRTAFKDRSSSNVVTYYTSTGAQLSSYKTFAIKIVMTSEEGSHIVPRVSDMRAIALQV